MDGIKDKVVIVTGASSGIGEATTEMLAANGAKVMAAARREGRLNTLVDRIRRAGGTAEYHLCDVTQKSQVGELARDTIETFGRIDVMFNNAGLMPLTLMKNLQVEDWDQTVDVNIKGTLYGIGAVLPHMLERGDGHIINVSSIAGHGVWPGYAVYSGTKWAVRAISEGLRQEVGDKVRVTVISPGIVETELTDHISDNEIRPRAMEGRFDYTLKSEDIARAVCYAIQQPGHVDVNEILVRANGQGR